MTSHRQDNDDLSDDQWSVGLRRLENGDYWHAHEAWEDVWLEHPEDSAARRATKALIQLAAICYKPEQAAAGRSDSRMQRGMQQLLKTSRSHLSASRDLGEPSPDFDRDQLESALNRLDAILEDWKAGLPLSAVRAEVRDVVDDFAPRTSP